MCSYHFNLLDRFRRGAVIDFIDLRVWPVFNLADAAIVSGTLAAGAEHSRAKAKIRKIY